MVSLQCFLLRRIFSVLNGESRKKMLLTPANVPAGTTPHAVSLRVAVYQLVYYISSRSSAHTMKGQRTVHSQRILAAQQHRGEM